MRCFLTSNGNTRKVVNISNNNTCCVSSIDWINLAQARDQWQADVHMLMNRGAQIKGD